MLCCNHLLMCIVLTLEEYALEVFKYGVIVLFVKLVLIERTKILMEGVLCQELKRQVLGESCPFFGHMDRVGPIVID